MGLGRSIRLCLLLACLTGVAGAVCPCQKRLSVCNEVAAEGSVVFVGTVESITPKALGYWNLSRRPVWDALNSAYERVTADPSAQALAEWKSAIARLFPDLPEKLGEELTAAGTRETILKLFNKVLGEGTQVRFRIDTIFHDDDDDDDDASRKEITLWTPFGDCGVDFQPGERYLVFGVSDEGTEQVETNRCMRTRRLSDAGADLAYLYVYKEHPKAAGRLEGVATYDPRFQPDYGTALDLTKTGTPAPGVVLELRSALGSRFVAADRDGRFVFDGLAPGDYQISAYARGFPEMVRQLTAPRGISIAAKGCANQIVLIPRAGP